MKKTFFETGIIKYLFFSFSFSILANISLSQGRYDNVNFESQIKIDQFIILDTTSNNIWRIGTPNKTIFTSAQSKPKAIVTSLSNYYPTNQNCSFIVKFFYPIYFPYISLYLSYKIDSDSLNDYGKIELSKDNGKSWIDLYSLDSTKIKWMFNYQNNLKPVFTGNLTDDWNMLGLDMDTTSNNIKEMDTLLFKFSFISDSKSENREGWIIDNIMIGNYRIGINESIKIKSILLKPNLVELNSNFIISFNNTKLKMLSIYNSKGVCVIMKENPLNNLEISTFGFSKGVYIVTVVDEDGKQYYEKLVVY